MSRTLSANAQTEVAKQYGTEPINILEVSFNDATTIRYCDKTILADGLEGKILSVSALDEIINLRGSSSSASITVELDDTDGSIKAILDQYDLHKRPAKFYQYYQSDIVGWSITDAALLLSGKIVSPIIYSEGKRTVRFDVLSEIISKEAGFSPEEGQFPYIPDDLMGQTWPLAFGECLHIPAVKALQELTGTTLSMFGVPDATLPLKKRLIEIRIASLINAFNVYGNTITAAEATVGNGSEEEPEGSLALEELAQLEVLVGEMQSIDEEIEGLQQEIIYHKEADGAVIAHWNLSKAVELYPITLRRQQEEADLDKKIAQYQKIIDLADDDEQTAHVQAGLDALIAAKAALILALDVDLVEVKAAMDAQFVKLREQAELKRQKQAEIDELTSSWYVDQVNNNELSSIENLQNQYIDLILQEDDLKQRIEDYQDDLTATNKQLDFLVRAFNETAFAEEPSEEQKAEIVDMRAVRDDTKSTLDTMIKELKLIEAEKRKKVRQQKTAEHVWDLVTRLRAKLQELNIEIIDAQKQLDEINRAIANQQQLVKDTVVVQGGYRFPQTPDSTVVSTNNLIIGGQFNGNLFSIGGLQPTYTNVALAARQNNSIRHFWISDPSITLKGLYLYLNGGRIARVTEQDGTMCKIEVVRRIGNKEQNPALEYPSEQQIEVEVRSQMGESYATATSATLDAKREAVKNEMLRGSFRDFLPGLLIGTETDADIRTLANSVPSDLSPEMKSKLAAASEYTVNEIIAAIEGKISERGYKDVIDELNDRKNKLIENRQFQIDADNWDDQAEIAFKQAYQDNITAYRTFLLQIPDYKDLYTKIFTDVSEAEKEVLERLNTLNYMMWRRSNQPLNLTPPSDESTDPGYYYFTTYDIEQILEASPIILPKWLFGWDLGTNKQIADFVNSLPDSEAFVADVGSEIKLHGEYQETFVANILPSTVHAVYAYKGVGGVKRFVPVPSSYYTKYESYATTFQPMICTVIVLKKPLRDYQGEQWDDDIYVSLTSSVGPNTADIIKYLMERYTNITMDNTTYTSVKASLTNYPSNFCLFDKRDTLTLVKEIAWQARCAAWVKNGVMYLRYLSIEPDSVLTLTEDDIDIDTSINVTYSETEELITKLIGTWQPTYQYKDKKNKMILRANIAKYGEITEETDFFIYNIQSLVEKSATFWLIRRSNTWKKVIFETFLKNLKLETLDCVTLDFDTNYFANGPVKCLVEKAEYDSESQSIQLECWTPVRSGEMTEYDFAWPGSISVQMIYPTQEAILAGNAGSANNGLVPTNAQYQYADTGLDADLLRLRPKDYGSFKPSDDYDNLPDSPVSDLTEIDYQKVTVQNVPLPKPPKPAADGVQGVVPMAPQVGGGQFSVEPERFGDETVTDNFVSFGKVIGRVKGTEEQARIDENTRILREQQDAATTIDDDGNTIIGMDDDQFDEALADLNSTIPKNQVYEMEIPSGKTIRATQIQIDDLTEIPVGTTTLVVYDKIAKRYQIQVPVWADRQIDLENPVEPSVEPNSRALQVIQRPNAPIFPGVIQSHVNIGKSNLATNFEMIEYTVKLMLPKSEESEDPTPEEEEEEEDQEEEDQEEEDQEEEEEPVMTHPADLVEGTVEIKAYIGYPTSEILPDDKTVWIAAYGGYNYIIGVSC